MTGKRRQYVQSAVVLALWLTLAFGYIHAFFAIQGFALTTRASEEVRPGWEAISLALVIGVLLIGYAICAVVVGALFRALPGRGAAERQSSGAAPGSPMAHGRDQDVRRGSP